MTTQTRNKISKEERASLLKILEEKKLQLEEKKLQLKYFLEQQEKDTIKIRKHEFENKIMYLGHEGKGYLGPYDTWDLNVIQDKLIKAFSRSEYKVFAYTGANRIGKTFISFILIYSSMDGKFPWEPDEKRGWIWEMMGWKPPIKVRWVGMDWEKHIKTVLIPKIQELWPKTHPLKSKKNNIGVEAFFTEGRHGGTLEIMSNNQDSALFEGWSGNVVVYDEPPKRDIRIACARGLIDFKGREIFSMTLLSEAWVDEQIIRATEEDGTPDLSHYCIDGDIYVNEGHGIDKEGIDQFAKTLTPEERKVRIDGEAFHLSGKVLKINRNVHILERFPIPVHWPVDVAIDIGIAKPHDILFMAISPRGFYYCCFEMQVSGDGIKVGNEIIETAKNHNLRINRVIVDPLSKADKNQTNTTWEKIDNVLYKFGYMLEDGGKAKGDGILRLNDLLSTQYGEPGIYFFRDLRRTIMQCDAWIYDENGVPKKYKGKQLPGDDQCENLYRLALLETNYEDPEEYSKSVSNKKPYKDPYSR